MATENQPRGDVYMIVGGPSEGRESIRSRKAYVRSTQNILEPDTHNTEVCHISRPTNDLKMDLVDVTFFNEEARYV